MDFPISLAVILTQPASRPQMPRPGKSPVLITQTDPHAVSTPDSPQPPPPPQFLTTRQHLLCHSTEFLHQCLQLRRNLLLNSLPRLHSIRTTTAKARPALAYTSHTTHHHALPHHLPGFPGAVRPATRGIPGYCKLKSCALYSRQPQPQLQQHAGRTTPSIPIPILVPNPYPNTNQTDHKKNEN